MYCRQYPAYTIDEILDLPLHYIYKMSDVVKKESQELEKESNNKTNDPQSFAKELEALGIGKTKHGGNNPKIKPRPK